MKSLFIQCDHGIVGLINQWKISNLGYFFFIVEVSFLCSSEFYFLCTSKKKYINIEILFYCAQNMRVYKEFFFFPALLLNKIYDLPAIFFLLKILLMHHLSTKRNVKYADNLWHFTWLFSLCFSSSISLSVL